MGILIFLLVVTLVIAVHEYGHYLACRIFGIPVEKFGVGFGKPLISRTDKRGTEWSLRPIPLGGFITPNDVAMQNATPFQKFAVAIAGPLANLLPFALIAAVFGKLGAYLELLWTVYLGTMRAVFDAVTFNAFAVAETATKEGGGLMGPIGIATSSLETTPVVGMGFSALFLFAALSIGIGLLNLLPLPPLDGGKIVLSGVEGAIGRERTKPVETVANITGALILLLLFIIVMVGDIRGLFTGMI